MREGVTERNFSKLKRKYCNCGSAEEQQNVTQRSGICVNLHPMKNLHVIGATHVSLC